MTNPVGLNIYHQNQVNISTSNVAWINTDRKEETVQSDVSQVNPVFNANEEFIFKILKSLAASESVSVSDILTSLTINPIKLYCTPRSFNMMMLRNAIKSVHPPVSMDELLTQFPQVDEVDEEAFSTMLNAGINHSLSIPHLQNIIKDYVLVRKTPAEREKETHIQERLLFMIQKIKERQVKHQHWVKLESPDNSRLKDDLELFLKNIILDLRKKNISLSDKKDLLENLVTEVNLEGELDLVKWHHNVHFLCKQLTYPPETVEEILLQCLQLIKNDLLSKCVAEEALRLSLPDLEAVVFSRLTPSDIFFKMKQQLDLRFEENEIKALLSEYIDNKIKEIVALSNGEISEEFTESLPTPFQDEYTYELTDIGVLFLLVHFGILDQSKHDNNLIQATTPTIQAPIPDNNALRV